MPVLSPEERTKLDAAPDAQFYASPRFVQHVDDAFVQRLRALYRERLAPGMRLLDLMGSWVSHLPEDVSFAHVEGHGLNAEELDRNPLLDHAFVQDLNEAPLLPLRDAAFDAVLCAASVQYLQRPGAVFEEVARVLRPGGLFIVSFSNRMFFSKAIQVWRTASEAGRVRLVERYLQSVPRFEAPEAIAEAGSSPAAHLFGQPARDPFYAVLARRTA